MQEPFTTRFESNSTPLDLTNNGPPVANEMLDPRAQPTVGCQSYTRCGERQEKIVPTSSVKPMSAVIRDEPGETSGS
jgi:hypothetical protein